MTINPPATSNQTVKPISTSGYPGNPITATLINGFFTVDRKWTVQFWNKAAEKLLQVRAEDIVGKNLWQEFADILPIEFYTVYQKAFQQDAPVHFEEYWGEMGAWFEVIIYHCDDTLSVSFKNSNQKTEKYPEQQMKMLNELYRFVAEVTNDCLWEWNLKTKEILWIDGGHKRVFGYQIENALIPQSFWESRLHPEDKLRIVTRLNKIMADGVDTEWEDDYRFKRANGDYAYVHDRGHIIYDEDKVASVMIGATQDITSRKLSEIKLLESERKLSLIARQTVSAIVITDAEEKITWINNAFTRVTEYEPEEVMGRNPGSFLQGADTDPSTVEYLNQKIKDKQAFDCEIINYSKSGRKYWMLVHGQPLLDDKGNFEQFFAIRTDITERVLLENKLVQERMTKQKEITAAVLTAQETERADIGKDLHDNLNQVLAVAKLYVQMAQTNEKNREMYLAKSCEYIVNVIEEVRKIAKKLVIPGTHIIGLFDNIKNLLKDITIIHPIKISFQAKDLVEDDLNEKMQVNIFRIVQEQVNNILKHANATMAKIILSRQGNEIVLFIGDNGDGCDLLKEKNGVGIINIKSRVELYDGIVIIISKPGKGFKLKVVLPLNAGV